MGVERDTKTLYTFFVRSHEAYAVRDGLRERDVTFIETKWQPGIRRFEIAEVDVPKLEGLIG